MKKGRAMSFFYFSYNKEIRNKQAIRVFQKRPQIFIIGLFFLFTGAAKAENLQIVTDGKSPYQIYVSPDALAVTVAAAKDLQQYLAKTTKAKLSIVQESRLPEGPFILVGDSEASRALGVDLSDIPAEGFRIKTIGKNLVISGRDTAGEGRAVDPLSDHWLSAAQAGTWNGVCQFLETALGVRWFFPGEDGEYIPEKSSLSVPPTDLKDSPAMIYRRMSQLWSSQTGAQRRQDIQSWERHNRGGWSSAFTGSHIWRHEFKGETYFKDHPDWFALVGGRRLATAPLGIQMCTTSSGALDEFAKTIIASAKQNPGVMHSLGPNDGGNFCECDNCRALDLEKLPNGSPSLSDRIMTYANEIAMRVVKVVPDQTFGIYAYSFYADPPKKTKIHPSIAVMNVLNDISPLYLDEEFVRNHLQRQLIPWKKSVSNLFFYSFPQGFGNLDLPVMSKSILKNLFNNLAAAEINGYSMNNTASFASSGLNNYLSMKMCWNPKADFETIYADAMTKCYGDKSAAGVQLYFDHLESRLKDLNSRVSTNSDMAMGSVRTFPTILDETYPRLYEENIKILEDAQAQTMDKGQKSRIQLLIDNLKYTKLTSDLYLRGKSLLSNPTPSKEEILKIRALAVERNNVISQGKDQNLFAPPDIGITYLEKELGLQLKPEVFDFLLAKVGGGRNKAELRLSQTASPVIDGKINDAIWDHATTIEVVSRKDDGTTAETKTEAKVARDKNYLYVAVICDEPLMGSIKDTVDKSDGPVWNDNEVEFFFDTQNAQKDFFQIAVNTLGTVLDIKNGSGKTQEWDSKCKAAVTKETGRWTLEIAIPFSTLSEDPVLPGDIWGMNICRVRQVVSPREYTCWSPTFGAFGQPKRFGALIFK